MKVAAYCRVSTEGEEQASSFRNQIAFFEKHIREREDWELYRIYADEGLSGTEAKKRPQFLEMMAAARSGAFRLLLTKEVSRFSRNLLDTIAYTRELKGLGIGILFLNDGINSLDADAELRLSIMASLAQEESRRTSQRVLWGQSRQMEKGVVFGQPPLGYVIRDGKLAVEAEEAELVRLIFRKYALEGMGTTALCRYLEEKNFCTKIGNRVWRPGSLLKILQNEKYLGDLVQRKSYTEDFLSHKKRKNRGEVPLIVLKDRHPPIVERELWELAQEKRTENRKKGDPMPAVSRQLLFSGKIRCGCCGSYFTARKRYEKNGNICRYWRCGLAVRRGAKKGCGIGKSITEETARLLFRRSLCALDFDRAQFFKELEALLAAAEEGRDGRNGEGRRRIRKRMERLEKKQQLLLDAYCCESISREELERTACRYKKEREDLEKLLEKEDCERPLLSGEREKLLFRLLEGEEESESLCRTLLSRIRIFPDGTAELRLKKLEHDFYFRL